MSQETQPPDLDLVLGGLKDFQLRTVRHVHERFYLDADPTSRFLVADEVGLGKTLVARGVAALALSHLWDKVGRIDVVYICSNAEIARQNVQRLSMVAGSKFARPTRLTLMPEVIHGMREQKVNFVSLTPGTSFSAHSFQGMGRERALLYAMLKEHWGLGNRQGPFNVFCYGMDRDYFRKSLVKEVMGQGRIDSELKERFIEYLDTRTTLRQLFDETQEHFQRRQRDTASQRGKDLQRQLIGDLRACLARSCVDALEPDLIILDEFQRFKHLLPRSEDGETLETEAGELARQLFSFQDQETGSEAKTLMLSATPYQAFGVDQDDPGRSHQSAFMETVSFLLDDERQESQLDELFTSQRAAMLNYGSRTQEEIESTKTQIESILTKVMVRTERLASDEDRNGMLEQIEHDGQRIESADILAHVGTERIARELGIPGTIEYWKSAPFILNFMDDYKLKRELKGSLENGASSMVNRALLDPKTGLLSRQDVAAYANVDPGNSRLRSLAEEMIDSGAPEMLWLAPSLPYYEPTGPFSGLERQRMTKRLVFSSWNVVPKTIASVMSYLAQRSLAERAGVSENSAKARKLRSGRLAFGVADLKGMPVLSLIYPSFFLAELVDPVELAKAETRSAQEVIRNAQALLEPLIAVLIKGSPTEGPADQTWYWATPFLLDFAEDESQTLAWLSSAETIASGETDDEDGEGQSGWSAHLERAQELLNSREQLGRPPADLVEVVARMAIAGPGVAALRALTAGSSKGLTRDPEVRRSALEVSRAIRSLFNLPEAHDLLTGIGPTALPLWRQSLNYCVDGCLPAVLDEYAYVLREHIGFVDRDADRESIGEVASSMAEAIGLRATTASVDYFESSEGGVERVTQKMRTRFALRFGDQTGDDESYLARADSVRAAFNSPFWPFVLASTSVGQEGLDFHLYCHAVVHWNLPSNPVDLEQREGRVHRYKGHAIRKNLAAVHGHDVLARGGKDPWGQMFEAGAAERPEGESELWPYWMYTGPQAGPGSRVLEEPALIERHIMAMRLSKDRVRFEALKKSLVLYRSVLGQPRQKDLIEVMEKTVPEDQWDNYAELLKIDLRPPIRPDRKYSFLRPEQPAAKERSTQALRSEDHLVELMRKASGIQEVKPGHTFETSAILMLDNTLGTESTQRFTLKLEGEQLNLYTWPGELKPQAEALYRTDRAQSLLDLVTSEDSGWGAETCFHLAYRFARLPEQRLYTRGRRDLSEYIAGWSGEDWPKVGACAPERVESELWPWLLERGYALPEETREVPAFVARLGKRDAHLRPGIKMIRPWSLEEAGQLNARGALAMEIRNAMIEALRTLDEPTGLRA